MIVLIAPTQHFVHFTPIQKRYQPCPEKNKFLLRMKLMKPIVTLVGIAHKKQDNLHFKIIMDILY